MLRYTTSHFTFSYLLIFMILLVILHLLSWPLIENKRIYIYMYIRLGYYFSSFFDAPKWMLPPWCSLSQSLFFFWAPTRNYDYLFCFSSAVAILKLFPHVVTKQRSNSGFLSLPPPPSFHLLISSTIDIDLFFVFLRFRRPGKRCTACAVSPS